MPNALSSMTSSPDQGSPELQSSNPAAMPEASTGLMTLDELRKFRESPDGKALVKWVKDEFSRCQNARSQKQRQWYLNMAHVFGHQWLDQMGKSLPNGVAGKLIPARTPNYVRKRTINRLRSFVRSETSKFLSTLPTVEAIPASGEDSDTASAQAAEQVWQSYSARRQLRREYSRSLWWMVVTGNGFLKTWWDPTAKVCGETPESVSYGDVMFRSVTPFHLFVPDLREREVDDQPYTIHAQVKNIEWIKQFYAAELEGAQVTPSTVSANTLLDEAYLNLQNTPRNDLDSAVIYEMWVQPMQTALLPNGGFIVVIEDVLVALMDQGIPYDHKQQPFTKFEHLFNDTFYADSPLVDLIPLQKEYNDWRTDLSLSAKRMGRPQIAAVKGSIDPNKLTNEPGQIILYNQGFAQPTQLQPAPIPEYVMTIGGQVLQDFEDLSGQHEVSRGDAPPGVTAGTAISFLQEKDDQFLTPQYQNVEDGFERVATQTLSLFQQFVDLPRQIKVIGRDQTFDTITLAAADIKGGTDVRVEPGSSIGQSMAAKRATVMDMFSMGIITDPNQALQMLEIGGAQRILSILDAARKKANRENMKMRLITEESIEENREEYVGRILTMMMEGTGGDPAGKPEGVPWTAVLENIGQQDPETAAMIEQMIPPVVQVDDFDDHMTHIMEHNRFRMGQEYEAWPDWKKAQMDQHVQIHEEQIAAQMQQQMAMSGGMMPGEEQGPEGGPPPEEGI